MKLMQMIMFLIILQISIMMFAGTYSDTDYNLNPYNVSEQVDNEDADLWNFVTDPTDWGETGWISLFIGIFSLSGIIAVGTFLYSKSDMALRYAAVPALFGIGAIPIISLYHVIAGEVEIFGCSSMPCFPALLVFILSGGLIAVFYTGAVLDWWSTGVSS